MPPPQYDLAWLVASVVPLTCCDPTNGLRYPKVDNTALFKFKCMFLLRKSNQPVHWRFKWYPEATQMIPRYWWYPDATQRQGLPTPESSCTAHISRYRGSRGYRMPFKMPPLSSLPWTEVNGLLSLIREVLLHLKDCTSSHGPLE